MRNTQTAAKQFGNSTLPVVSLLPAALGGAKEHVPVILLCS